ncbi:MAG: poly-beta-1,6-N-acetyl-D-glucosamine N-deacetylase PgaB [Polaromonas sp.]|uniref:poly-beta-1,6-N-acetyl-D-glucosamine N-deacetylase PgaB n=1 Tax=Polaromonas sp. TaxID=1869339 RepID=UPI002730B57C|nr:poly-beta-1,6-N-acetyl-D-glucosamine N-deacetylase PgaB [Polaromonas sp.]MDP2449015.1 poly-beta-1,6-N-acetyl-D-glucosamine N-deacetylase PgaB [Polaromonas sp.]MDP3246275.1 poly-beta-1,6-N-acetyl-D-glucosamine N-deacetylase PgaB [Polaromonas sp.]MDP3827110.1 poly-beta-1,6-N-acetyl-D-glucosamine N-deacetylase PgaB [Polaromonas sp.]
MSPTNLSAVLQAYGAWRLFGFLAACVLLALPPAGAQPLPPEDPEDGQTFRVLSFHDVRDNVRASFEDDPEETAIDERTLTDVFAWLAHNKYQPVSLQQIVDARAGRQPLPRRPVLLTFDDGYSSVYTKVFPLLQRYRYPAVVALVTSWLEVPDNGSVPYGARQLPRDRFLRWDQAAEMVRSGLVELASHTHAMHQGVQANPQGNLLPMAATHRYDPATGRYEDDAAYVQRVEADLRLSRELIEARTGAKVRATVWPYGAYNARALLASEQAGMPIAMRLTDGPNSPDVPLSEIRRALVVYNHQASDYAGLLRSRVEGRAQQVNRVMHVDLDYVYDPDPVQQEKNLSVLIERVATVAPSSVFLQAYADPDGDGVADALYFPNRHLPVRSDLFGRVAWQLKTRAGVNVYAWMPVMAFQLPEKNPVATKIVVAQRDNSVVAAPAPGRYHRLSPFDAGARALIGEIYDDLGRHAVFNGVLFHDDATLSDDEDASPAALAAYERWGLPGDVAAIRRDPVLMARWTSAKTQYLIEFTQQLVTRLRAWQPVLMTARNVYAGPLLDPTAEQWFAQNYEASLAAYDYVALMAMPRMEGQKESTAGAWLSRLARRAATTPHGLNGTLFELQAIDWRTGKPVSDAELMQQWRLLQRQGVRHIGYYPDDFLKDQPTLKTLQRSLSVRSLLKRSVPNGSSPQIVPPQPAGQGTLTAGGEAGAQP